LKKSLSPASRRRAWNLAETMLVAGVSGAAFEATGLPAGLVAGSVLAVAAMAVLGRPMMMPANLTRAVLVIVGIALGSVITPSTIAGLAAYPQSIALLLVASFAIMLCTGYYLRAVHGWTGLSALLGANPGALAQAIALSLFSACRRRLSRAAPSFTRARFSTLQFCVACRLSQPSCSSGSGSPAVGSSGP
jgi:uncharacterized membrane protein AbrB (regulator of aidB expression)